MTIILKKFLHIIKINKVFNIVEEIFQMSNYFYKIF